MPDRPDQAAAPHPLGGSDLIDRRGTVHGSGRKAIDPSAIAGCGMTASE
jgi:hypothetical protein